jgi:hypothetical protein
LQNDYPEYLDPCSGISIILAFSSKKKDIEKELINAEPLANEEDIYIKLTPYGNYLASRCFIALGVKG